MYDALRGLVKGEWWLAPTWMRTEDDGRVTVRGFRGDYAVSAGADFAGFSLAGTREARVALG